MKVVGLINLSQCVFTDGTKPGQWSSCDTSQFLHSNKTHVRHVLSISVTRLSWAWISLPTSRHVKMRHKSHTSVRPDHFWAGLLNDTVVIFTANRAMKARLSTSVSDDLHTQTLWSNVMLRSCQIHNAFETPSELLLHEDGRRDALTNICWDWNSSS